MAQINVTNKFLSDVTWLEAAACSFKIDNSIDVWKISAVASQPLVESVTPVLTGDEIARANRYYRQKDRDRFIISRAALRNILGKYLNQAPAAVKFETAPNKKPFVRTGNPHNLQYNLSHSGGAILLAVADTAIGADVEFINHDFGYKQVLADNFSEGEIRYITGADAIHRFFKLWTRKEAITKATGQGLDCDLRQLPGMDGTTAVEAGIIVSNDDWLINSFNVDDQHIGSVAGKPFMSEISFFTIDAARIAHSL